MYKKLTFSDWLRSLAKPNKTDRYITNTAYYSANTALYRKHSYLARKTSGNFFKILKGKTVIVKF